MEKNNEHHPFRIDDFPIGTTKHRRFSVAMISYQRVYLILLLRPLPPEFHTTNANLLLLLLLLQFN